MFELISETGRNLAVGMWLKEGWKEREGISV